MGIEMDLFLAGLKEIAGASSQLTTWALAMLGGSVAVVIGSSHYSPAGRRWRSFYFLLAPVWIFLLVSVRAGNELSRSYLAALFTKGAAQDEAFNQINADFQAQLDYLFYGVIAFAVWLTAYLLWWVLLRDVDCGEGDA
ncbi:hypothetical protein [Pseudomonas benzenivorans]|uniref:Uncharacterized protein n=1 Tax=Pseudomonas benzenivorans TaxID=556533 RepID=A0ABY5H271_9PSED|nr:hypothetical protein [Pseudomonas benzenivorans]UTW06104.1 hypothetical protein KDW96_12995 [Pseudomonas benzenivorans]